jgi:hypothetical protein
MLLADTKTGYNVAKQTETSKTDTKPVRIVSKLRENAAG